MAHPRCPDCHVAGTCVFEWTGHRPYCDWMRRGGAWRARVIELSEAGPPPTFVAESADPERPSVAESLELIAAMKACPFRSIDPGCGCSGGRCSLKRGEIVNHQDCFACIREFGKP